jgi:hypothetical protein
VGRCGLAHEAELNEGEHAFAAAFVAVAAVAEAPSGASGNDGAIWLMSMLVARSAWTVASRLSHDA